MKPRSFSFLGLTPQTMRTRRQSRRLLAAAVALTFTSQQASAAEKVWDGGGTDNSWGTALNWVGDALPTPTTDSVTFGLTSARFSPNLGGANRVVAGLTFDSATSYNLRLYADDTTTTVRNLSIGSGGITVNSGSHTISGGTGSGAGALTLTPSTSFSIAQGATLTISTRPSGGGTHIKTGLGTLVFNTNSGGGGAWQTNFAVSQGTLRFAAGGASGNSGNDVTVSSGATLELAAATAMGINGIITLNGTGLNGVGALYASATTGIAAGGGSVILLSDSRIGVTSAQTLTLSNAITNVGGLEKSGTGTLTLSAANTYTGATKVSEGLLSLGNSLALQNSTLDTTASIVSSSATTGLKTTVTTLTLGGLSGNKNLSTLFDSTNGYTGLTALTLNPGTGVTNSYDGAIANGAANMTLTKTGAGTQILSGTNTYTGTTLVSAGTLLVNGSLGASAVTVSDLATFGGSGSIDSSLNLGSDAIFMVVDLNDALMVAGTTTFGATFGIDNLAGINWDLLDLNTAYTLINTSQAFDATSLQNFGLANAANVGTGDRQAYFQNVSAIEQNWI